MNPAISKTYVEVTIDGETRQISLDEGAPCSIGRSDQNTVVLADDLMVSRRHALIQRGSTGECYLTDLGSRNGTTLNGRPVTTPVSLRDGDTFVTGNHHFVFREAKVVVQPDFPDLPAVDYAPTNVLVVRRLITVLVIDIRNYTVLSRELGEARISEIMNRLFHAAGELLKRKGSWAQKYIGDAVMAVWVHDQVGIAPKEVLAILESLTELSRIVDQLNGEFVLPRPLAFGAGLNSGLAATGNMGSAGLSDYTAMGDTVNKAFRLETASKELQRDIIVGKSTFTLMSLPKAAQAIFTAHSVNLKGYDQPEQVFSLQMGQLTALADTVAAGSAVG